MAKRDRKTSPQSSPPSTSTTTSPAATLVEIRQDADLWYRIHVLLYDLSNVAIDPSSEKRISSTTHELYISEPYFLDSEAARVRTALIDDAPAEAEGESGKPDDAFRKDVTVEEAIHNWLSDFFEKRKASGDARPCGPHDMVPAYASVFEIVKEDLKDERFLSRLRRSGLGESRCKQATTSKCKAEDNDKGRKKAGRAEDRRKGN